MVGVIAWLGEATFLVVRWLGVRFAGWQRCPYCRDVYADLARHVDVDHAGDEHVLPGLPLFDSSHDARGYRRDRP